MAVKKGGLGRGLSALLEEMGSSVPVSSVAVEPRKKSVETDVLAAEPKGTSTVPIARIAPNPKQPRRHFDETLLAELADSIKLKGVLQPILVRPVGTGKYEIIAGERRWRASQMAGLHDIPAVIRSFSDADGFEAAIIENVQRSDLNPLEEALGYQRLIQEFGHTQEMVASVTGKARSHIANLLRLLDLPEDAQSLVKMGLLTVGHAKAALQAKDPSLLAKEIAARGLTVRQAEEAARKSNNSEKGTKKGKAQKTEPDADLIMLENSLSDALGLKVSIATNGTKGVLSVTFSDLDQLDRVIERLQG